MAIRGRRLGTGACAIALGGVLGGAVSASTVDIDWVVVGNPGNPAGSTSQGPMGSVAYKYRIGRYEVTNAQYAAFLNAKAATSNALGLYNSGMTSDVRGGIQRTGSGTPGDPWVYASKPNMADKPVNYLGWYDCIRFVNWLNNGQGAADTESGAYTLLGGTAIPTNPASIVRNPGGRVWLPNNNEWHKAGFYEPGASGDGYWNYATRHDAQPAEATANEFGDVSNPGPNVCNYNRGADWAGQDGNVSTVGGAGPLSRSFYGTADQSGNVFEWCENLISGTMRANRGGSWVEYWGVMFGGGLGSASPTIEIFSFGLRPAAVFIPADLDLDGDVDGLDLAQLLAAWTGQAAYKPCPPALGADLNGDCHVDGLDLGLLLGQWG